MESKRIDPDILARYLSGDCLAEEQAKVERWMDVSPQNRKKFIEFKQIWNSSATSSSVVRGKFDTAAEWEKLNVQIGETKIRSQSYFGDQNAEKRTIYRNRTYLWIRVAAIVLICALIGFFVYENGILLKKGHQKPSLREITTAMGERVNLTLSDGTEVILNAGSKLKLPRVFNAHKREVFLKGEAYFHVAKNQEKPFIVHSGKTSTRVLGTHFSVSAYPSDSEIRVAVKEGTVAFKANDGANTQQTILHNREVAEYNLNSQHLQIKNIRNMGLYLGWIDGYLEFNNAPMQKVAVKLQRRYGIKVSFKDSTIKNMQLTALLKSRSVKNVLNIISLSLKIDYQIKGDRVIFMK